MQSSWLWHAPSWIPFYSLTSSSLDQARPCRPCMSKLTGTCSSDIPWPHSSTPLHLSCCTASQAAQKSPIAICCIRSTPRLCVCSSEAAGVLAQQLQDPQQVQTIIRAPTGAHDGQARVNLEVEPQHLEECMDVFLNVTEAFGHLFHQVWQALDRSDLCSVHSQFVLFLHWLVPSCSTQVYRLWSDCACSA